MTIGFRQGASQLPHAAFLRISPSAPGSRVILEESVIKGVDWERVLAVGYAQYLLGSDAARSVDEIGCARPEGGSDGFSGLVADLYRGSIAAQLPPRQVLMRILQRGPDSVNDLNKEARDRGLLGPHDPRLTFRPQPPSSPVQHHPRTLPADARPTWQMDASAEGAMLFDLPGAQDYVFHVGVRFCRADEKGIPPRYLCGPAGGNGPAGVFPQALEVRPATWHAGGATVNLTAKAILALPLALALALGPELQIGHLPTAMSTALTGNHPRRSPQHLQAVASVHRFALHQGTKPHDLVAQVWRVELRTAMEWARRARRAGLLDTRANELKALSPPRWPRRPGTDLRTAHT
ncbi:hypothetical protein ACFY8W_04520 [Streptomyces sp. NPDC012637]|uniref:hypothetical protein n=1 Tax=Streptomyces sp. NPDC012637 TaxID=3364842 RepID=UPI0036E1C8ED